MRKYSTMMAMYAAMLSAMSIGTTGSDFSRENTVHNGVERPWHPWDNVNLSKSERKGKSYEELQALRKQRYEESLAIAKAEAAKAESI